MKREVTYYETLSKDNTEITFKLAQERMKELGINKLVIASTTGETAKKARNFFKDTDIQLIIVAHQYDFVNKENPFPKALIKEFRADGHEVHIATMLFHTEHFYGTAVPTLMANILRAFSEGVKVCYEITLSATDGGYLTNREQVAVIAGTGRGADTALIMQASSTQHYEQLKINEILCKPLNLAKPL